MYNDNQDACTSNDAPEVFEQTFKLVGDFWNLRTIDIIGTGELRFAEIERGLGTCNPVTITSRLKRLEEQGVLIRHTQTRDKQSVTYRLTQKGLDLLPILAAIKSFTRQYPCKGN
jgi:DNA-binding HxlR family transcriptional regulator